jgi:hypothetical protein
MKSSNLPILFSMLTLALGAFAYQGSMQQPAQTPGTANQTSQQPGVAPPATESQPQPGTVPSVQGQAPQAEPSQAPPMRTGNGVDDQVNALSAVLNLTSAQQAKVKTILESQHQQALTVVSDNSLSRDVKVQKMHELRQSTIDKVRGTLTGDEQKNKFDNMVQAQNERIREREQQQQQGNTPPQPK